MKKFFQNALPVVAVSLLFACSQNAEQKPAVVDHGPEMKARFMALANVFSSGDTVAADTLLAANMVDHETDTSMHLPPGIAGFKAMVKMYRTSNPDLKCEIHSVVAEGDMLMAFGTFTGTNSGMMMGMAPTNKTWSADFADVVKFGPDMKMIEHWGVFDTFKMMQDMGMMSMMGPANAPAKGKKK